MFSFVTIQLGISRIAGKAAGQEHFKTRPQEVVHAWYGYVNGLINTPAVV